MDEDDFYDPGEEDGLEWFYVEDEFTLADELAETQTADPSYAGTNFEIEMERYDFDLYEYWDDIEYGIDTYWDGPIESVVATANTRDDAGLKRKRAAVTRPNDQQTLNNKRRRIKNEKKEDASFVDTVMFVSLAERFRQFKKPAPTLGKRDVSWALLPDWRDKFGSAEQPGQTPVKKSMPSEMRKAAERDDHDDDTTPVRGRHGVTLEDDDNEYDDDDEGHGDIDNEGEDEYEDDDEEDDGGLDLSSLNPETLKTILRQRLGDAGLADMDENAFMRSISQMLSGEGNADDATDELANSLLGQAAGGGGTSSALSGWLSQQGVSLEQGAEEGEGEEEEEEAVGRGEAGRDLTRANGRSSHTAVDASATTAAAARNSRRSAHAQVSPPDSAIEVSPHNSNNHVNHSQVDSPVSSGRTDSPKTITTTTSRKRTAAGTSSTAGTENASKRQKATNGQQTDTGPSSTSTTAPPAPTEDPPVHLEKSTVKTSTRKRKADAENEEPEPEYIGGTVATAASKRPARKKRTRG